MLILAFDTTAAACSVAVVRAGTALATERLLMAQGQAEALVPLIEQTLVDASLSYDALDRIAVTIGPGSFTGVRVGLSTARAIGLAADKPVVGVSTLEVLAAAIPSAERARHRAILAAVDTKRGDVYVQLFDPQGRTLSEAVALPPAELAAWISEDNVIIAGDGASLAAEHLPGSKVSAGDPLPDVRLLAQIASARTPEPDGPLPLYIMPPRITLAPHGGRLRP